MEKVVLTKDEYVNIIKMYESSDKDNHTVANEILNNCDLKKSLPWVLLIYAASNNGNEYWNKEVPKMYEIVKKYPIHSEYKPSVDRILSTLLNINAEPSVVDTFLEWHVEELTKTMGHWGYPTDKLNYSITLKHD